MFKRKRKPGQLVGTDLDWFVIPIRTLKTWGILVVLLASAAFLVYTIQSRTRRSPLQKARAEIATARELIQRASPAGSKPRRGSFQAQARDFLQGAEDSFSRKDYDAAYRLAVESQSYSRRASGGTATDEPGDASLISVEGDVSIQTAGRAAFAAARPRQSLFDGDFIKTGRTGSAEIMFSDGTLYSIRPGSLFEVRRPASSEAGGSQIKMVSGAISVYTAASSSTVSTDAATASIARESRVGVEAEPGEKTDVTTYRGKATVSTGKETVVLADREKISAGARTRQLSAKVSVPDSPALMLPPDNRVFDVKTSQRGRSRLEPGGPGGALPDPDLALPPLRSRRDGRRSGQPQRDDRAGQGRAGGVLFLARRRDRFLRAAFGLERRQPVQDGVGPPRPPEPTAARRPG